MNKHLKRYLSGCIVLAQFTLVIFVLFIFGAILSAPLTLSIHYESVYPAMIYLIVGFPYFIGLRHEMTNS